MTSHYLFFEQKDSINLLDVLRPRSKPGQQKKTFIFDPRSEKIFGDLLFYVMNDAQRQRIRGEAREAVVSDKKEESRSAIYAVSDMVTASLVNFTSTSLDSGVKAYRTDFFSPVQKKWFAYASPYGKGTLAHKMADLGINLEMLKFVDYQIGQPVGEAVKGTFATYHLALVNNNTFTKYQGRGLALVVPAKLIEREK